MDVRLQIAETFRAALAPYIGQALDDAVKASITSAVIAAMQTAFGGGTSARVVFNDQNLVVNVQPASDSTQYSSALNWN